MPLKEIHQTRKPEWLGHLAWHIEESREQLANKIIGNSTQGNYA